MELLEQYYALAQIRPDSQKLTPVYELVRGPVHVGPEVTLARAPAPKKLAKARSAAKAKSKSGGGDGKSAMITVVYV